MTSAELLPDGVRVLAGTTDGLLTAMLDSAAPYGLLDLTIKETSLETVFISMTGRELRE